MNDKTAKKIIGITALTAGAYLALKATGNKEEGFGSGNFGGLGGGGITTEGTEGGDSGGQPININFPAIDPLPIFPDKSPIAPTTVTQTDIVEDISGAKDSKPTTKKDSLIKSSTSKVLDSVTKAVTIEPMTLKSGSTKTAIAARSEQGQPWSLSESSIQDVKSYVGTPANVVDEQIKKVKESLGTNVISQPGNTFSEYTAEEKARSKTQMSFFDKVIGKITSPMKEEPRVVTTGKNVISAGMNVVSPVVETVVKNITTTPTAWSRGTVKTGTFTSSSETYDPSNPSGAKETLQTTKKEATTKKVVSLQEAASRSYDDLVSKASGSSSSSSSSSGKSSGSSGSSKSSSSTTKKKVVSLKQAKTVRDD